MSPYSLRVDIGDIEIRDDSSIPNREVYQEEGIRLVVRDRERDRGPDTFGVLYGVVAAWHHSPYRDLHRIGHSPKTCGKLHLERVIIVYSIASRCIPDGADFPL
jgi:hypothetical protein